MSGVSEWAVIEPEWTAPARVRSAFTLRGGGVSVAPYDSLNLGVHVGDMPAAVAENRRRVKERFGLPAEPIWLTQVHGTRVVDVGALGAFGDAVGSASEADAAVARTPGRVCVIQVADCMPVLFAARDGSAVGAAHAGWRGLAGGVLEQTIAKLGVPPAQLVAWLGPTISQKNFEVGDDVRAAFTKDDAGAAVAFEANSRGRWQCDLYALARRRLAALGVSDVSGGGWCTFADPTRFFSFRRDGQCGRMVALIWMEA
jgi:purine-nucleoside/S-methyl-5'-thioadenosine phosphorylase / adenosine deaminase